ncbi:CIA30 family protein [Palleronia aestuarii]|nr:CIA30 family protein [Palleronia aestuarii]
MTDPRDFTQFEEWSLVSDQVMGGVSTGTLVVERIDGRDALRMRGGVRLENDGGFLQMARDLTPDGTDFDASGHTGVEIEVIGNGESYNVHLRTADVEKSWQSYRATFDAPARWTTLRFPFDAFSPHRIEAPFDAAHLRRIGLVAIGRAFHADLALGSLRFY